MSAAEFLMLAILVFVGLFAFVLLYGAPYLPTRKAEVERCFKLADLKPGQKLIDLGSGDGVVLMMAGQRGIHAIGYELNPLLVLITRLRCYRYRKFVKVYWRNFWRRPLPESDVIFVFLIAHMMERLDAKLNRELKQPTKVLSYTFTLPRAKPQKVDGAAFLYLYPRSNS